VVVSAAGFSATGTDGLAVGAWSDLSDNALGFACPEQFHVVVNEALERMDFVE
jgi:hypothetical protein